MVGVVVDESSFLAIVDQVGTGKVIALHIIAVNGRNCLEVVCHGGIVASKGGRGSESWS